MLRLEPPLFCRLSLCDALRAQAIEPGFPLMADGGKKVRWCLNPQTKHDAPPRGIPNETRFAFVICFLDAAQAVLAEVAAIMSSIGESHGKVLRVIICCSVSHRHRLSFVFIVLG